MKPVPSGFRFPSATYRLQLNRSFTFQQAAQLVEYLQQLGVSDVYAAPIFAAPPESNHGYDVCDYNCLNPVLGSGEDLSALSHRLQSHGMGLLLDFVPNHMGTFPDLNPWWRDVLERGRDSAYAAFFDINWRPRELPIENKILLPVLEDHYEAVLHSGKFHVDFRADRFELEYNGMHLPFSLATQRRIFDSLAKVLGRDFSRDRLEAMNSLEDLSRLCVDAATREVVVQRLRTLPELQDAEKLHQLLEQQAYRLSYWRSASRTANYRRFFDVDGLVGVRMELPEVFHAAHELLLQMIQRGQVTGLRLDHIDGLADPLGYLRRLQAAIAERLLCQVEKAITKPLLSQPLATLSSPSEGEEKEGRGVVVLQNPTSALQIAEGLSRPAEMGTSANGSSQLPGSESPHPASGHPLPIGWGEGGVRGRPEIDSPDQSNECAFFVVAEKITMAGEELPANWPVAGTTGYDFARDVIELLIDNSQADAMSQTYVNFTQNASPVDSIIRSRKNLIMSLAMSKELNELSFLLHACAQRHRHARDILFLDFVDAIRETISCFPVYRTYIVPGQAVSKIDRQHISQAVARAKSSVSEVEPLAFNFLEQVLLNDPPLRRFEADFEMRFITHFQQFTGPVMAKGYEDTAFFVFNRLIALNEVGGNPAAFGIPPERFHELTVRRAKTRPHTLLATSTHDTKTSEDVRARIAALSELVPEWTAFLASAAAWNQAHRIAVREQPAPDPNEEYFLYQILLGTWPFTPLTAEARASYVERLQRHMLKALKEAKIHTRWDRVNPAWENAVTRFVAGVVNEPEPAFLQGLEELARIVAELGAINSLSQTLLKMTVPGIPDFYQGCEVWQFLLADPDNRQPVDFQSRARLLETLSRRTPAELLRDWQSGAIKQFLIRTMLNYRRQHQALFDGGDYIPLTCTGAHQGSCIAFMRATKSEKLIVVAPRLTRRLGFPPIGTSWEDTVVNLPFAGRFHELFTGQDFELREIIKLSDLFNTLPFAALALKSA